MQNELIANYTNGNAHIEIFSDGTRVIEYPDDEGMILDNPLNIDIRVSTQCSMGLNPKTGKSICSFCHESATTDGTECNYDELLHKLQTAKLPRGIELAIGANAVTENLVNFLDRCFACGYICSITVNQAHVKKYQKQIKYLIDYNRIKGLGISYRDNIKFDIPKFILEYKNTVFHVIVGIDKWKDITEKLPSLGVRKILILGEKDFGFNMNKVDINSPSHREWRNGFGKFLKSRLYQIISFDNLALKQLDVKSYISNSQWDTFYQGEHSMYINAVAGYYADSSRSFNKKNWNDVDLSIFFKYNKIDNKEKIKCN